MPRRSERIYVFGTIAFVQSMPSGHWIKTHICVTQVACETCFAKVNEPCRSTTTGEHVSYTHYPRRDAAIAAGHRNNPPQHMVLYIPKEKKNGRA